MYDREEVSELVLSFESLNHELHLFEQEYDAA
jgi:hypothetical protein